MKTTSVLGVTPFWPEVIHSDHHSHFNPFAVNNLRIAGYSQRLPTADREPFTDDQRNVSNRVVF